MSHTAPAIDLDAMGKSQLEVFARRTFPSMDTRGLNTEDDWRGAIRAEVYAQSVATLAPTAALPPMAGPTLIERLRASRTARYIGMLVGAVLALILAGFIARWLIAEPAVTADYSYGFGYGYVILGALHIVELALIALLFVKKQNR